MALRHVNIKDVNISAMHSKAPVLWI